MKITNGQELVQMFFSEFIAPSPLKAGKSPVGRDGKGCLSLGRDNGDVIGLHLSSRCYILPTWSNKL